MLLLKQSTSVTVKIGPFLDDTDGKTAETGLTISQADVRLSKNGGNMAQKNESSASTHDEIGIYDCDLDTTDTGTLGVLRIDVQESGALPVWHEFMVVPANVYDSLVGGSDKLQVDVEEVDGDATAAANLNSACDNYSATRGLAGTALPAAAADAAGGLPISDAGGLDLDTQLGTDIDAILADTNELQTNQGDWATAAGFSTHSAADVADAVWDEAAVGHTDAGKAGAQLWTDIDAILEDTDELQSDDIPGTLSTIDGKIDTIDTNVDAVLVDTGTTLEGHLTDIKGAGWSDENLATIDSNLDAALADTDELQTNQGDWATAAGFSTHSAADVVDEFETQSQADPTGFHVNVMEVNGTAQTAGDIPDAISGLNDITAADVWDATSATLSVSFETLVDRLYRFLMNKMNITDATGAVALRNEADNGDIATQTITDDDTTTTRTALSWS